MVKHGDIYNINAWIGLSTHTPLHKDPYHNIFAQLYSRKNVIIFPPTAHGSLQLHSDRLLKNTSRIRDIFEPHERNRMDPEVLAGASEATIETGDGLYIPEGWFHSFKGDQGVSSSVNWWFR
ncbi:protein of unknown function [Taphrina deformans PYCC 5710]|uniref:JmjC domain-containing protein n=1 Tax=Taphrina deformans (strain PYCC 5710 / ATCC 11124 / CBS 356.35 / IMI 108563 / JCM 9778 / NBRC 8474) TaxID=1097556 RepID=R4XLC5_TAPDE|nr:protein of unknown function [Taphrina deformans PYCC 5710]|eukprot:CCG84109.1 protein of unknown function [Taphrina deformans PYCC 5710]